MYYLKKQVGAYYMTASFLNSFKISDIDQFILALIFRFKNCELNNKTAHRTHNNTVSWFIPLQSNSQNSHQTR